MTAAPDHGRKGRAALRGVIESLPVLKQKENAHQPYFPPPPPPPSRFFCLSG